ncbi:MAG: acyltransferase domain-containing protein [Lentisphaerae bacterium]|nr:acyltransferase domain-containing protein [Lentisphaerota bacterium]MCP4103364.1 acyltransferase domain-containing protein [Lentisphaerota bacterium]
MKKIAVLCSGQGRQEMDMFKKLNAYPECSSFIKSILDENILSPEVSNWLSSNSPDEALLFDNIFAQELICLYQLAIWQKVKTLIPKVNLFTGYSLGEACAYAVSEALTPSAALQLIRKRAEFMTEASAKDEYTMFGLIGLPENKAKKLAEQCNCHIAIYNPDNLVIGGQKNDICQMQKACESAGAERIVPLQITVPSHTPIMKNAAEKFQSSLGDAELKLPRNKIILEGVSGRRVFNKKMAAKALTSQIYTPLRWDLNLSAIHEYGCQIILELGPGKALANMTRQAIHHCESRSLDEFHDLNDLSDWLKSVSNRV